ncbi:uncharacterized protein LOC110821533 isoform X3 [Carica papaya]|uniref:uncharacterized protein LOC110821533 isoform X3 n=1 Tax=Carica papaya TaxID=3649 RepID=UPI000B8CB8AB|nr:uncharacterized protein LOC110821533 isoform X3 [Carica papaya]
MEIDHGEEEDPFLAFIEYARSVIAPTDEGDGEVENGNGAETSGPGWSWIASRILKTCIAYSSGVTAAILLSDLSQAWNEQHRVGAPKKRPELINQLKKNHRRTKLPNTVTIDSIYEKNFLSLGSVLEVVIVDTFVLPGTNIYMLTVGDFWSSSTIDLYLHRREVLLTGCYLRTAREGSSSSRLLPTEYLVILLDEDQDDDAVLIGAQFCSDSFSSISLDAVNDGASYSLYARIESIGSMEIHGKIDGLQKKQITLIDNDGIRLKFLLWGEQVPLANLFSVGSMLALDRPYIASSAESGMETNDEFCLEYGSATQLYLVPVIQHEEQVSVALTQSRYQGSRLLSAIDPSQGPRVSQVSLPCDSQGSIDFSNYPFRSFIVELRDKMTSISLYGVVRELFQARNTSGVIFSLKIEDTTGAIWAKLHFSRFWSLGRIGLGHVVYISGLTCCKTQQNRLEVLWDEKNGGAALINLSCLPALLNSSCLHKSSCLTDLFSGQTSCMHVWISYRYLDNICRVRLDQIDHCHVSTRLSHSVCGHFVNEMPGGVLQCSFCHYNCSAEVLRTFHLKIALADDTAKIFAWCTGQTATELLQISPDEFCELSEDEQFMYPSSLENEIFMVALVNCKTQSRERSNSLNPETDDTVSWEITRALKLE